MLIPFILVQGVTPEFVREETIRCCIISYEMTRLLSRICVMEVVLPTCSLLIFYLLSPFKRFSRDQLSFPGVVCQYLTTGSIEELEGFGNFPLGKFTGAPTL